ncbi:MAG: FGGY-family carbohydrate kinase [Bacteroidota bacterium]
MKAIAIFDIGKTNKKFIIFDQNYEIIFEKGLKFDEKKDEDGFPTDDMERLERWIPETLEKFCKSGSYDIMAVNFSAYGASLVHLNDHDKRVSTFFNYLKPIPDDLIDEFFEKYGKSKLPLETESPVLGMLNAGMQLYWIKKKRPELFNKISHTLNFPEYCSFLLTGKKFTQMTSLGSHTMFWDFKKNDYHEWTEKQDVKALLPKLISANHTEKINIGNKQIMVGVGLHDSSAALIPYLKMLKSKFVLISSGTWNISMNPFNQAPLTLDELKKDCLSFISYEGKKVKSSRVFLGNEYEYWRQKLETHFKKSSGYHKRIKFDPVLVNNLLIKPAEDRVFLPQTMKGTGPLPGDYSKYKIDLNVFKDYNEAYHQLILDLTYIQKLSLDLVLEKETKDIIVSGGFTSNEVFLNMLAGFYPHYNIYSTKLSRASSLGAAMILHEKWNNKSLSKDLLAFKDYKTHGFLDFREYQYSKVGSSV